MEEILLFCAGFCFHALYERIAAKAKKEKTEIENTPKEEILDPMILRNGFGVTKDRNPTFAEQWVNIMNFDGRNQKEGDYEEGKDYAAENLG